MCKPPMQLRGYRGWDAQFPPSMRKRPRKVQILRAMKASFIDSTFPSVILNVYPPPLGIHIQRLVAVAEEGY